MDLVYEIHLVGKIHSELSHHLSSIMTQNSFKILLMESIPKLDFNLAYKLVQFRIDICPVKKSNKKEYPLILFLF